MIIEIDLLPAGPGAQFRAPAQQISDLFRVMLRTAATVDGYPPGDSVLRPAKPAPPRLPHIEALSTMHPSATTDGRLEDVLAVVLANGCRSVLVQGVQDADCIGLAGQLSDLGFGPPAVPLGFVGGGELPRRSRA